MTNIVYSSKIYRLLSTDEKPTGNLGDMVIETDTGLVFAKEANGWAEVITSDNLKSGSVEVTEDSFASVVFTTAFASVPNVVATVEDNEPERAVSVYNITVNGFDVYLSKENPLVQTYTVHWIATDVENA